MKDKKSACGEPILVTGGAGYIGSHIVRDLGERGYRPVVLDNLSSGHAQAVLYGELIRGDVGDGELLASILRKFSIRSVMHFAAFIQVGESVSLAPEILREQLVQLPAPGQGLPGERRGKLHLLLDRRGLRHAQEGPGRRKGPAAAHQPLWRLQAGQRNDPARRGRRQPRLPLRGPALLQRRRRRPPGAAGPGLPPAHPPADPGAENRPGPFPQAWKCSGPTTRPRTARPSATTSTSTTWPAPTCWRWNF